MIKRKILPDGTVRETKYTTYEIRWVRYEWAKWNDRYREVRRRVSSHYPDEETCYICRRPWEENEQMALANFTGLGNRTICGDCGHTITMANIEDL